LAGDIRRTPKAHRRKEQIMSTDRTTPTWGQTAGAPSNPRSSRMVTIVIAVVAALVLVGGGIAIAEAAGGGSSTGTNQGGQFGGPGAQNGGPGAQNGGPGGPGGPFGGALHGDFVASDGNGGYATKRLQSGTVTAVSSTSISAKSADGHSTTFAVSSSTSVDNGVDAIGNVKTGDTVTVVGTVSGGTATATSIFDATLGQTNGQQMGNPGA
jgi:hypothetical protein